MTRPSRFSPEVRERAVRMVVEHEGAHDSQWAASTSIAEKIGCTAETLRKWVRQAAGPGPAAWPGDRGAAAAEAARAGELRAAARQRDPEEGGSVFPPGGARPRSEMMVRFIAAHRAAYGVEPICAVLPIAPSLYYELRARQCDPERRPPRARRDERLSREIQRTWHEEHEVYG